MLSYTDYSCKGAKIVKRDYPQKNLNLKGLAFTVGTTFAHFLFDTVP